MGRSLIPNPRRRHAWRGCTIQSAWGGVSRHMVYRLLLQARKHPCSYHAFDHHHLQPVQQCMQQLMRILLIPALELRGVADH